MTERQDEATTEPSRGVFSFTAGGVAVYQDIAPADPTISSGAWTQAGERTFRSTIWSGQAANEQTGVPAFIGRADSVTTVDGDTMSSTYVIKLYDATTNEDLATLHGTMTGTRITA